MANKKISEITASTKNFRDLDYLEGEAFDGVESRRYTGSQIRAVEKGEREEADTAIGAAIGASVDTDFSWDGFTDTNFIDAATSISDALELLDGAVASPVVAENVGDGDGEVYKEKIGNSLVLRTIKGSGGNEVTTDGDEIDIEDTYNEFLCDTIGNTTFATKTFDGFSDTNFLDAATSIADGLEKLDAAIATTSDVGGVKLVDATSANQNYNIDPNFQFIKAFGNNQSELFLPAASLVGKIKTFDIRKGSGTGSVTILMTGVTEKLVWDNVETDGITTTTVGDWVRVISDGVDKWYIMEDSKNWTEVSI
jgi:hypothetical protein